VKECRHAALDALIASLQAAMSMENIADKRSNGSTKASAERLVRSSGDLITLLATVRPA
jgi:hypothetical protein